MTDHATDTRARCQSDVTLGGGEHRHVQCGLWEGHDGAHTDGRGTTWTAPHATGSSPMVLAHWDGFVEWFEDDGATVVCRFVDVDKPLPEMTAAIPRENFEPSDRELLEGTYVEWFIAEGSKPRIKEVPPITEEEIAAAKLEAERLMEAFKDA